MNPRLLDILVCPEDHGELELVTDQGHDNKEVEGLADIRSGHLKCRTCGRIYPIVDGVPRFTPKEHYSSSFGFQWNRYAKTQLDSHSGLNISRARYEEVCRWKNKSHPNPWALEAGCGAGRFSELLAEEDKQWVCVDASSAVEANARNNGHRKNLHFIQADLRRPPFRPESFARLFCLGVLQHTPDPEHSFFKLLELLQKDGGEFAFDIYAKTWDSCLWSKYWLRPLTKKIKQETLFQWLRFCVPPLLRVHDALRFIPKVGRYLAHRCVPVCQYKYSYPLSPEQNLEWALLDTFDMLAPQHDHPKSIDEVQDWLSKIPNCRSELRPGPNGLVDCITLNP